jgi:hypothetical protein
VIPPKNGCFDHAPYKNRVMVQDGWTDEPLSPTTLTRTRMPVIKAIPNPNTKDCQYSLTTLDEKCEGCKWKQELKSET